jgi:hypothetical protein
VTQEGPLHARVHAVVKEALGVEVLVEHAFGGRPKNLQEALGCTSLEIVSVQLAIEEAFGLTFATGAADRGPIDEEWDALWSMSGLTDFVEKWSARK